MKENALKIEYEIIELFGERVLLYQGRIDRTTVPNGFFMYEARHLDEDWGTIAEIAKDIVVNFYGTIISKTEILLNPLTLSREIGIDDVNYLGEDEISLVDWK